MDPWFDLLDYIASEAELNNAVYIFQCLNNALLVGKSCCVLAFTGAVCAAICLIKVVSHAEFC
ncbi:hypothetical protein AALP_AA6G355400 [Arabis alpina]|uniref:Uncharacterized protein n=1 Tax=Arabis alpina TaxID=50452 RepID=A0A087GTT7_ARAAL|nr:hypothetical protein AALP_AA6G355400 [Arabis alpina]